MRNRTKQKRKPRNEKVNRHWTTAAMSLWRRNGKAVNGNLMSSHLLRPPAWRKGQSKGKYLFLLFFRSSRISSPIAWWLGFAVHHHQGTEQNQAQTQRLLTKAIPSAYFCSRFSLAAFSSCWTRTRSASRPRRSRFTALTSRLEIGEASASSSGVSPIISTWADRGFLLTKVKIFKVRLSWKVSLKQLILIKVHLYCTVYYIV